MTGTSAAGVKILSREDGFTLIDLLFVVGLIGVISTLAIPGLMRARGAAQSASALATIRVINSAQLSYAIGCGLGFYAPDFVTLTVKPPLASEAFLPAELATGLTFLKSGYNFSMGAFPHPGAPATCNGLALGDAAPAYAIVADEIAGAAGRFFGTNSDGVIYEHHTSLAATMPVSGPPPQGAPLK